MTELGRDWAIGIGGRDSISGESVAKLRALVDSARCFLAEVQATYTVEKAKVDSLQATLFKRLRAHRQERDRLQLVVDYRTEFLEALLQDEEDADIFSEEFRHAQSESEREYEETASTFAAHQELTADEAAEVGKLWKKLVKLYHPDRFSHEPDKLDTYSRLTAAINRAKDTGNIETLREIADDPHAFILKQGWTSLDFREEEEVGRLQKLWESLEREIASVLEATKRLHESAEFELCELIATSPEMLDTIIAKQIENITADIASLQNEANQLAEQIEQLTGQAAPNW